jgi:hypothetical protein
LERPGPVFVVEGPTDALAMTHAGLACVGRPSNVGGVALLIDLLRDLQPDREVVVVGEFDPKGDGRWPGRDGAVAVASGLRDALPGRQVRAVLPPERTKDARAWLTDPARGGVLWPERGAEFAAGLVPVAGSINVIRRTPAPAGGGDSLIGLIPPVLGPEAYYGFVGGFLRAVAPFSEATDAGVLAHLLPAIGTLIGPGPVVYAGTGQPARLNSVLVGPSSTGRKGTAFVPVDVLVRRVAPEFWDRQRVGGLSSGEGLIAFVADKVIRGEDGEELVEPVEKRLYVVESELSRVLANTRREGNVLSQIIREAFDSGNLATLTVNPRQAVGAHISITGHITPEELGLRMPTVELANGFANRFLWWVVKSDKVLPLTDPIPDAVFDPFATKLKAVAGAEARVVPLDPDAKDLWAAELYPDLRADRSGLAGVMLARGQAIVPRVALVYALLDGCDCIEAEHLRAGMAVWRYHADSCRLVFGGESASPVAAKLFDLLRANGPMKRSAFTDHVGRPGAEIDAALRELEAAGRVTRKKVPTGGPGRPAEVWELVPEAPSPAGGVG